VATTTSSNYTSLYGGTGGTVVPTTAYGNANVVGLLASGTDGANTVGNITSAGQITATGNIQTSAYFIGDGSLLTNLAGGSYGNANVAAFLPTYTGAMTAMTGAVTTTANISGNYFVGNGSLLTGITGSGTYGNANVAANLAAFANNPITTTGNVSAGYFLGNGSQLTGLPATYGNANVVTLLSAFGSNTIVTTGNITGGNFIGSGAALSSITGGNVTGTVANATFATSAAAATTAGTVTTAAQPNITSTGTLTSVVTTGNISATGNITGNYYIGNGSLLTGITGSGTYGDANVVTLLSAFGSNTIVTTGNITGNYYIGNGSLLTGVTSTPGNNISVSGNVQAGGFISAVGNVTGSSLTTTGATGNITGVGYITADYFVGNGSLLTNLPAQVGGSNTQIQFNNGGAFAGNAAATFDIVTGNLTIRNTTFNTANAIVSTAAFDDSVVSSTVVNPGRILIGTGTLGNNTWTTGADATNYDRSSAVVISNRFVKAANSRRAAGLSIDTIVTPAANISTSGTRVRGGMSALNVGGGASNFNWTNSGGFQSPTAWSAGMNIGNDTLTQTGNTVVTTATGAAGSIYTNAGSTLTNGFGVVGDVEGNVVNSTAFAASFYNENAAPANVYGYWMGGNSSTGYSSDNGARNATNYYFLRNDDPVAQAQLGSLRTFHEYRYDTAAVTGNLSINKLDAQVQYVPVTANITNVTFTNFVVTATTNTQTKYQTDTVTVIFRQGATGYNITLPTGTAFKYASGISTMGSTANAVQMLSVTGIYDSTSAGTQYLITVSPEFV